MRRIAVAAALLITACGGGGGGGDVTTPPPPPPPPAQGTVQGRVVNETEAGIANVSVQLTRSGAAARSATTNATGNYSFTGVDAGAWNLGATLPTGFEAVGSLTATVQVTGNQTTTVPHIRMRTAAPPNPGNTVTVAIYDFFFEPSTITVQRGGTVQWSNAGAQAHNSTSQTAVWTSPNLPVGGTFQRTFPTAGTFAYSCTLHPGMNGTVVVQ